MQWYFLSDRQEQIPITEQQMPVLVANGHIKPHTMMWREGLADWAAAGELKPELFAAAGRGPRTLQPVQAVGQQALPHQRQPQQRQAQRGATTSPYNAPAASASQNVASHGPSTGVVQTFVKDMAYPIARAGGWMKFIAVMSILTTLGNLLSGVMLVVAGVASMKLKSAGGASPALFLLGLGFILLLVGGILIYQAVLLFRGSSRLGNAMGFGQKDDLYAGLSDIGGYFKITGIMMLSALLLGVALFALSATVVTQLIKDTSSEFRQPGAKTLP